MPGPSYLKAHNSSPTSEGYCIQTQSEPFKYDASDINLGDSQMRRHNAHSSNYNGCLLPSVCLALCQGIDSPPELAQLVAASLQTTIYCRRGLVMLQPGKRQLKCERANTILLRGQTSALKDELNLKIPNDVTPPKVLHACFASKLLSRKKGLPKQLQLVDFFWRPDALRSSEA